MRSRTLGNSSTSLIHTIDELHSEAWMNTLLLYLTDCDHHHQKQKKGVMRHAVSTYQPPPPYQRLTSYKWILACYARDVLSRLQEVKGQITSVYGRVLKMDSTKKVSTKFSPCHNPRSEFVIMLCQANIKSCKNMGTTDSQKYNQIYNHECYQI